ncbi:MAG: hypothetical protein AAFV71_26300 [Cyanobacteria bacterium J06633_8]
MTESNDMSALETAILGILVAATAITVGVITIEYVKAKMVDEKTAILEEKIQSKNADSLVASQEDWKNDFKQYVDTYLQNQTNGVLSVEEVTISSGSVLVGLRIVAAGATAVGATFGAGKNILGFMNELDRRNKYIGLDKHIAEYGLFQS